MINIVSPDDKRLERKDLEKNAFEVIFLRKLRYSKFFQQIDELKKKKRLKKKKNQGSFI